MRLQSIGAGSETCALVQRFVSDGLDFAKPVCGPAYQGARSQQALNARQNGNRGRERRKLDSRSSIFQNGGCIVFFRNLRIPKRSAFRTSLRLHLRDVGIPRLHKPCFTNRWIFYSRQSTRATGGVGNTLQHPKGGFLVKVKFEREPHPVTVEERTFKETRDSDTEIEFIADDDLGEIDFKLEGSAETHKSLEGGKTKCKPLLVSDFKKGTVNGSSDAPGSVGVSISDA